MIEKLCFVAECMYPNYVNRFKNYNLKRYLELDLNIPYYVQTNMVEEFSDYKNHPYIRVYDVNELRKYNSSSNTHELLPESPIGLYPAKYPWNLRRFILEKAAEEGYLGLFFTECDTKIKESFNRENLLKLMVDLYEPNTVKTSAHVFVYKNRNPSNEVFYYHDRYISDLNLNFEEDQYNSLDGTNQLFFAKEKQDFKKFFDNLHFLVDYGYTKEYGYKNTWISNLSFNIPMSNFELKYESACPFITEHKFEDRS